MATFYLVRHGQTEWNTKGLIQGHSDSPLTPDGIKSAEILRDKFKGINFDLVYSSDLLRAKRTAQIILLEKQIALETTHLLRERAFGKYEGAEHDEYERLNANLKKLTDEERYTFKDHNQYESDEELTNRFITFIREVAVANPGKTILVVSHGSFMRMALMKMGFGDYKNLIPGSIKNGGWVKFETDGVDFFIKESDGIRKIENA